MNERRRRRIRRRIRRRRRKIRRRRVIGISGSLIWSKTLMEVIFHPCDEFWWSLEGPVSQIHSPHLHVGVPGIFSDLSRCVHMLKREWGTESNGKLPHLFIPSKTATLVPELAVEHLPFGRNVSLVTVFAVKDLLLGRTFWWRWWWIRRKCYNIKYIENIICII